VNNLWLLGGEIIRDLHYDPPWERRRLTGFSVTWSTRTVARLFIAARRRRNAPSTPPAASSTASSLNPSAEARQLPTYFPDEPPEGGGGRKEPAV